MQGYRHNNRRVRRQNGLLHLSVVSIRCIRTKLNLAGISSHLLAVVNPLAVYGYQKSTVDSVIALLRQDLPEDVATITVTQLSFFLGAK
jgi:hypothetical protein